LVWHSTVVVTKRKLLDKPEIKPVKLPDMGWWAKCFGSTSQQTECYSSSPQHSDYIWSPHNLYSNVYCGSREGAPFIGIERPKHEANGSVYWQRLYGLHRDVRKRKYLGNVCYCSITILFSLYLLSKTPPIKQYFFYHLVSVSMKL
jgi:hypothetical protein